MTDHGATAREIVLAYNNEDSMVGHEMTLREQGRMIERITHALADAAAAAGPLDPDAHALCVDAKDYDDIRRERDALRKRVEELEHENSIFRNDAIPAVQRAEVQFHRAAALEADLARVREELDQITGFTLERSSLAPESLRGDRDWWQRTAIYWNTQATDAYQQRDSANAYIQTLEPQAREAARRVEVLRAALEAADALACCEHTSGCGAQCRCGAWEERNEKRAEFYRLYRAALAAPDPREPRNQG